MERAYSVAAVRAKYPRRRRAQIDSVRQVSASLVEVRPEAMYDVAIHLRDGKTITLRMYVTV